MDVWEANSVSTALTPHSCQPEGYAVCEDTGCGGTYSLDRYAGTCKSALLKTPGMNANSFLPKVTQMAVISIRTA